MHRNLRAGRLSPGLLQRYLDRVDHAGAIDPTLATLVALHRAHLPAIPYENLDILGRELTLDPDSIFRKLVVERRGGWCYEMNGLFGRALESLGFEVRYVSGAVDRPDGIITPRGGAAATRRWFWRDHPHCRMRR
ncbi:MAG: arylamine N-acetyltransferase family protein [Gemmatimonadaceae bacterium]